jgi:hypothetical protein
VDFAGVNLGSMAGIASINSSDIVCDFTSIASSDVPLNFADINASSKVYSVSLNGASLKFLFKPTVECVSPEDAQVDFQFLTWCPAGAGKDELRLIDPASRSSRRIPDSDGMPNAVLSPDGQMVAAIGHHLGKLRIFQIKTNRWSEISIAPVDNPRNLLWSGKGDSVYLQQGDTILRCWIRAGHTDVIAHLPKSPTRLWWGDWLGVGPDDKLMLTRQTGAGDIYAFDLQHN